MRMAISLRLAARIFSMDLILFISGTAKRPSQNFRLFHERPRSGHSLFDSAKKQNSCASRTGPKVAAIAVFFRSTRLEQTRPILNVQLRLFWAAVLTESRGSYSSRSETVLLD